jgi:NACalpha-BTF3-like transcription factor
MDASGSNVDISKSSVWTKEHTDIIKYVCANTNLNEEAAYNGLMEYNGDYKKVIEVATIYHLINIVKRQTTLTTEEAMVKLKEHNGEPVAVIKEFMGIKDTVKEKPIKTTNQMVFSEIRTFMDDVNKGYNSRKERKEKIEKIKDYYKKK